MRRPSTLLAVFVALLLAAVVASFRGATEAQPHWVITDLGTLGGSEAEATAINNRGQVVGFSEVRGHDEYHAFLWQDGEIADLGTLYRGRDTVATDINERGQILCSTWDYDAEGMEVGFRPLLWERGRVRLLPSGGRENDATAINDRGQVVGWVGQTRDRVRRAVVWEAGKIRFLQRPSADSEATGLNESGRVIGMSRLGGFVWYAGNAANLDGRPNAINDKDQIVGERHGNATLWVGGAPHRPPLASVLSKLSRASDINERGQIVGWVDRTDLPWRSDARWAALWERDRVTLLPDLPHGGASEATAINDRGQVVGWSETWNGGDEIHAVLWTLKR